VISFQLTQHLAGDRVIGIELQDTFNVLPRIFLLAGGAEGPGKVHPNFAPVRNSLESLLP